MRLQEFRCEFENKFLLVLVLEREQENSGFLFQDTWNGLKRNRNEETSRSRAPIVESHTKSHRVRDRCCEVVRKS